MMFAPQWHLAAATGQDGAVQAGHPLPTPRFIDQGDGTVEDKLTDLIWLQNADCFGPQTWQNALNAANSLVDGQCGLSDGSVAGDWRLPNIRVLQSMIHFAFFDPPLSNAAGTGQCTATDCAFVNVPSFGQLTLYWSSTTIADNPELAWNAHLGIGATVAGVKGLTSLVWPVRGGQ